jgi:CheY-like chemotaxis protein
MVEQARALMDRQVSQIVRLVDDLLDVSRITGGRLQLRKKRVELADVLSAALETTRPLIEAQAHELDVVLPMGAIPLNADPTRLSQVFANLLNNAAKYTEKAGHIRLTAERRGDEAVVRVRDTGIGIPREQLSDIFNMFSQLAPALERSHGGLGIGLSLVKGLVSLHGGSIEAHSDGPGKGSEFIVRLPIATEKITEEAVPQSGEGEQVEVARFRLLIVDDLKDSADSLATLLKMMGHKVHTAYDGEDAVIAAEAFRPDVVLLDIGMPRMNGYDACRRIREQPWGMGMYLIALTGWGQETDRRRSEQAGFDHHMVKPVDQSEFMKLLASLPAKVGEAREGLS